MSASRNVSIITAAIVVCAMWLSIAQSAPPTKRPATAPSSQPADSGPTSRPGQQKMTTSWDELRTAFMKADKLDTGTLSVVAVDGVAINHPAPRRKTGSAQSQQQPTINKYRFDQN